MKQCLQIIVLRSTRIGRWTKAGTSHIVASNSSSRVVVVARSIINLVHWNGACRDQPKRCRLSYCPAISLATRCELLLCSASTSQTHQQTGVATRRVNSYQRRPCLPCLARRQHDTRRRRRVDRAPTESGERASAAACRRDPVMRGRRGGVGRVPSSNCPLPVYSASAHGHGRRDQNSAPAAFRCPRRIQRTNAMTLGSVASSSDGAALRPRRMRSKCLNINYKY